MRGKLTISLKAIQQNYAFLADTAKTARCAAVVKANAYGVGVHAIAPALAEKGVTDFFVALPEEGIELRAILPHADIYVLNGFLPGEGRQILDHDLIPVLNDRNTATEWQQLARQRNKSLPAVIHVDTGLNRLGFNLEDYKTVISDLEGINIRYVMSHLACADEANNPMNGLQRERFEQAMQYMPGVKASLVASDGIFCGKAFHFDMVRPGAGLYGINPTPAKANPLRPCLQLEVPVLQIRTVQENGSTGYGAAHNVIKGQRLATIAIGYADGFMRTLSNHGKVFFNAQALPVLGRVSMDVVVVDITSLPENALQTGGLVQVFGPDQDLDAIAKDAGMIGYEILTALGNRFYRHYVP